MASPSASRTTVGSSSAPRPITVLLADANDLVRAGLRSLLERDSRFRVVADTGSRPAALAHRLSPDLLIVDPAQAGRLDLALIEELQEAAPNSAIAVLSAHFDLATLVAAIQKGVLGYFLSTFAARGEALLDTLVPIGRWHVGSTDPTIAVCFRSSCAASVRVHGQDGARGKLTERERQVLSLASQGLDDQQIAAQLHIDRRTVEDHFLKARERLGAAHRFQLACLAKDLDLLPASVI